MCIRQEVRRSYSKADRIRAIVFSIVSCHSHGHTAGNLDRTLAVQAAVNVDQDEVDLAVVAEDVLRVDVVLVAAIAYRLSRMVVAGIVGDALVLITRSTGVNQDQLGVLVGLEYVVNRVQFVVIPTYDCDVAVVQTTLAERARKSAPQAQLVTIGNFLADPALDALYEQLCHAGSEGEIAAETASTVSAAAPGNETEAAETDKPQNSC